MNPFLFCALALPSISFHQPILSASHVPSIPGELVGFMTKMDPNIRHNGPGWELDITDDHEMIVKIARWRLPLVADIGQLPFKPYRFVMVSKYTEGLERFMAKEIARVLEYGGFLAVRERHDLILREFHFMRLPFTFLDFYFYQKRGTPPTGARHLLSSA